MKRVVCIIACSIIICALILSLVYFIRPDNPEVIEKYKVSCIIPQRAEMSFWQEIDDSMNQAAEDNNVDITMIYTNNSETNMVIDLNQAIEIAILSKTQAIVTSYSRSDEETDSLLLKAREAGIYVVLIDCDGPSKCRDVYVGIDNEAAGYALGTYTRQNLPEDGIALLPYSETNFSYQNILQRINGITRAFESSPEQLETITFNDWDSMQSPLDIEKYIIENENVGAVIALHESITVSCAQLLDRMNLNQGIQLYGFDLSNETMELLENGNLKALIYQRHIDMGYKSIEAAIELIDGTPFDSEKYIIEFEMEM